QELARLRRHNQLILDAAAEGIFGVDLEGVATFVNPAAERMIGRPADDVIRNDVHPLLHPSIPGVSTCDVKRCRLNAALRGQLEGGDIDETFFRDDGGSFPVEYSASAIQDETGRPVGTGVMCRDATEKRAPA